jgi:DNA (cytosine-5)-methyltransferase 1
MQSWSRYNEWIKGIQSLGYSVSTAVLDAADYRVPQARRRLFVVCDREAAPAFPPAKLPGPKLTAKSILAEGPSAGEQWPFRRLQKGVYARTTLAKVDRAAGALGREAEFLVVYYGSDGRGYQALDYPLRTITTIDRFAYVRPNGNGHEIRMLQPPELAAAMGFPATHLWPVSSRRDKIRLIGNAVCPPVMAAIIQHLTGGSSALATMEEPLQ